MSRSMLTRLSAAVSGGTNPQSAIGTVLKLSGPIAVRALAGLLVIALQLVYAGLLTDGQYGAFAFSLSVLSVLSIVATLGFDTLAVKIVGSDESGSRSDWRWVSDGSAEELRRMRRVTLTASILCGLGLIAVSPMLRPLRDVHVGISVALALILVADTRMRLVEGILRGAGRTILALLPYWVLEPGLAIGAGLVVSFWSDVSLSRALVIYLIGGIVGVAACAPYKSIMRTRGRQSGRPVSALLAEALPMTSFAITAVLQRHLGVLAVGLILTNTETGQYAMLTYVAATTGIFLYGLNATIAPQVARASRLDRTSANWAQMVKLVRLSTTAVTAAVLLSTGALCFLLFGPFSAAVARIENAGPALGLLLAAQLINTATGPGALLLSLLDRQRDVAMVSAATVIVGLALIVAFVPSFGLVGAAFSTFAGTLIRNAWLVQRCRHHLGILPLPILTYRGFVGAQGPNGSTQDD